MTDAAFDNAVVSAIVNVPTVEEPGTYFAPAGRDEPDELRRKRQVVENARFLWQALDTMPSMVAILSDTRQIVAANSALLKVLGTAVCEVLSKRPGEAVGCIVSLRQP